MGKPNSFVKSYHTGILNLEEGIGNWRLTNKPINFPTNIFRYNDLVAIPRIENEPIEVVDEWDTPAICKRIEELRDRARVTIGEYVKNIHNNILFVVPHNRLSQEIEGDATTYNMFFRIPVHKGDELPEFHHSNFDVIFFDEIYMTNLYIYI